MALANAYVLHGIVTPSNFYSVVTDATPRPVHDSITLFASGHPQPLFTATRGVRPEIVFTTHQVGTALAEFGLLGADLSGGNVDLLYRKMADHSAREGTAEETHIRLRAANAFGYIQSVRSRHRGEAEATIRLALPYDGTNAPIVAAGSVAVSGTSAVPEVFTLGPTSLNSTALDGVQESELDLAPEVAELGDDGEVYDTFVAVRSITPVLTLRGLDAAWWSTYGLTGTALTALTHYYRRKASDVDNVADGTTSHASIAATAGQILVDQSSGAGNQEVTTTLRINLRAPNASGNALTVSNGVAIS